MTGWRGPQPLIEAHRVLLAEGNTVRQTDGYMIYFHAVINCERCPWVVGDVHELGLVDSTGGIATWRGGPIVTGTVKRGPDKKRAHVEAIRALSGKEEAVSDDQYVALLWQPGLPAVLPFYCPRHKALGVGLDALRELVRRRLATPGQDRTTVYAAPITPPCTPAVYGRSGRT